MMSGVHRIDIKGNRTLNSVQALRAFAAILVVFGHILDELGARAGLNNIAIDDRIIHQFGFGVDIFFVISGFVMVYTTTNRERSISSGVRFLLARFLRISPLYWTVTCTAMGAAIVLPNAFNHQDMSAGRFICSLFYIPYLNASGDMFPVIGPGWTLNYEMFFYAAFAFAMMLPRRFSSSYLIAFLVMLALAGWILPIEQPQIAFYTNPILLEFAAGVLLGHLTLRGTFLEANRWAPALLLTGILWYLATFPLGYEDMALRFFAYGVPASLIVAGAIILDLNGVSPKSRWAIELGDASYSIYLIHLFAVRALRIVIDRLAPDTSAAAFVLFCLVASVTCGVLVARIFEIPFHRMTRRMLQPRKPAMLST